MALRITGAICDPGGTERNTGTVEFVRGFGQSAGCLAFNVLSLTCLSCFGMGEVQSTLVGSQILCISVITENWTLQHHRNSVDRNAETKPSGKSTMRWLLSYINDGKFPLLGNSF